MKATLAAINQAQADGVICHYAIGASVGAAYHSEPSAVIEIEVLVILPFNPSGSSAGLSALADYLTAHGWKATGEFFEIESWPVRFVVANTNLEREAVASSLPVSLDGDRVWVMTAEHLMAIALVANRTNDRPWMLRLAERDAIDESTIKTILSSHDLTGERARFEQEYPPQFPSKNEMRRKLALLSFSEKIRILEKLRERGRAIAAAVLPRRPAESQKRKKENAE